MGTMFRLIKDVITPAAGTRIVKAAQLETLFSATELIAAAQLRAKEIEEEAQAAAAQKKQEGYDDGRRESQEEYAEKIFEIAAKSVESLESLEGSIVKVVTEAVQRVIGELDDKERIVRIVRTALDGIRNQQHVLVRVAIQDEKAVRDSLAAMTGSGPGSSSFVDIMADPRLSPGSCLLESELGVLDASLDTQLKALERAFTARIQANASSK